MDSLDNTDWDVVLCGTGLPQSLLALALSRSELKVLHVDPNGYYGGSEAALSLVEAEAWATEHAGENSSRFGHASVTRPEIQVADNPLLSSRAYSLAWAPQLIYSRSSLIKALLSTHTHTQVEFQAVGSWFTVDASPEEPASQAKLTRVPGGREDVFQDGTLNLKEKRALMKFLRFVVQYEDEPDVWRNCASTTFSGFLQERFSLPPRAYAPIFALSMRTTLAASTSIESALSGISHYLKSIGYFGSGFGAVLPKWGGLAEVAQVACRACAVGGGVYVLGRGVSEVRSAGRERLQLRLSNGEAVTTRWLADCAEDVPRSSVSAEHTGKHSVSKGIFIVSSRLTSLFPQTSEGGVNPAGAVVLVSSRDEAVAPIHILVHSSESGECPSNQCVLYASVSQEHSLGYTQLEDAIQLLLHSVGEDGVPQVLWSIKYQDQTRNAKVDTERSIEGVIGLPRLSSSLVLEDEVLDNVSNAWQKITGAGPETFMKFEQRRGAQEDDEID